MFNEECVLDQVGVDNFKILAGKMVMVKHSGVFVKNLEYFHH